MKARKHGTDGAVSCLFPQFSVRAHDNKPNTNQLKVSVSACDVVAVTQLSAQEVEASWSSGLGGKTRQLMAERVQRLQRQKDKIFNLWLGGLPSGGNNYSNTF